MKLVFLYLKYCSFPC